MGVIYSPATIEETFTSSNSAPNPSHPLAEAIDNSLGLASYREFTFNQGPNASPVVQIRFDVTGWATVPDNQTRVFPTVLFQVNTTGSTAPDRTGEVSLRITGPSFGLFFTGITTFFWGPGVDTNIGPQTVHFIDHSSGVPFRNTDFASDPTGITMTWEILLGQHKEDGVHGGSLRVFEMYIEEQDSTPEAVGDQQFLNELI